MTSTVGNIVHWYDEDGRGPFAAVITQACGGAADLAVFLPGPGATTVYRTARRGLVDAATGEPGHGAVVASHWFPFGTPPWTGRRDVPGVPTDAGAGEYPDEGRLAPTTTPPEPTVGDVRSWLVELQQLLVAANSGSGPARDGILNWFRNGKQVWAEQAVRAFDGPIPPPAGSICGDCGKRRLSSASSGWIVTGAGTVRCGVCVARQFMATEAAAMGLRDAARRTPPAVAATAIEHCVKCGRPRADRSETMWACARDGSLWCPGCVSRAGGMDNLDGAAAARRAATAALRQLTEAERETVFDLAAWLRGRAMRSEPADARQLQAAAEWLRAFVMKEIAP